MCNGGLRNGKINLDNPDRSNVITRVLIRKRSKQEAEREGLRMEAEVREERKYYAAALKMKEGVMD